MDEATAAERVVRASVEAFNRHDLDGCMAFLAPGATWEVVGMGGQPLGTEELRIVFWQYFLRDVRIAIRALTAAGSRVAAEYVQTYTDDDQQRRLAAPVACFYEVRDGLIASVRQYYHPSWERAQEASGEEQRPAG